MNALVYGMGRSGRGALRLLREQGHAVAWHDAAPGPLDKALAGELGARRWEPGDRGFDTVVAAPGVPLSHPELQTLAAAGAEVIGELELAGRVARARGLPLVAVTGTAGKGGTSLLVHTLLRAHGVRAELGGNIDPPLCDVVGRPGVQALVAECSSFGLERAPTLRPEVAVITNLGVDHLDRHGDVAAYHAAKWHITARQGQSDVLVLPERLALPAPTRAAVRRFSPRPELPPAVLLPPAHHPANVSAALVAARALLERLGQPWRPELLPAALAAAPAQPGRFEEVARAGGVGFVDDSIATRTEAVRSALGRARPPVVWLLGGIDKGAELAPLRAAAGGVVRVLAFGRDGERMARELGLPFEVISEADPAALMPALVRRGAELLPGGGTVLLSPLGASFDLYRDYRARGEAFAAAAREHAERNAP